MRDRRMALGLQKGPEGIPLDIKLIIESDILYTLYRAEQKYGIYFNDIELVRVKGLNNRIIGLSLRYVKQEIVVNNGQ